MVEDEIEEPKKAPRPKMIEVRVIEKSGQTCLVEYFGGSKVGSVRVLVPTSIIKEGLAPLSELEIGVPHGYPWEGLRITPIDPGALARAFRDEGIFTPEDLSQKRQVALTCISRLSGLLLSNILTQVRGGGSNG